jgi:hypothetical protein
MTAWARVQALYSVRPVTGRESDWRYPKKFLAVANLCWKLWCVVRVEENQKPSHLRWSRGKNSFVKGDGANVFWAPVAEGAPVHEFCL